jgi:hypothetical protein
MPAKQAKCASGFAISEANHFALMDLEGGQGQQNPESLVKAARDAK